MPLSFYGLTDDLGQLKADLERLKRAHPAMQRDGRMVAIMNNLEGIIAEYAAKNREFETNTTCEGCEWDEEGYSIPCGSKDTKQYASTSGRITAWYCDKHAPRWAKKGQPGE